MPSQVTTGTSGTNSTINNNNGTTINNNNSNKSNNNNKEKQPDEEGDDELGPLIPVKARRPSKPAGIGHGAHPYTFIVYTSKKHNGRTSGDIIVIVYGSKNKSGIGFVLKKESTQGVAFLAGQKDYFSVQSKHLGSIRKVKLKPATSDTFSDWYLRKIIISDEASNTDYCFVCRKRIFVGSSSSYKMTVEGYVPAESDKEFPVKAKKLHFKPKAKVITLPPSSPPHPFNSCNDNNSTSKNSNSVATGSCNSNNRTTVNKITDNNNNGDDDEHNNSTTTNNNILINNTNTTTIRNCSNTNNNKNNTTPSNNSVREQNTNNDINRNNEITNSNVIKENRMNITNNNMTSSTNKNNIKTSTIKNNALVNEEPRANSEKEALRKDIDGSKEEAHDEDIVVNYLDTMVETNALRHVTSKYRLDDSNSCLVLRRGKSFFLTLKLAKPAKFLNKGIFLEAITGVLPKVSDGTLIEIHEFAGSHSIQELKSSEKWGYCVRSSNGCEVILEVYIPVNAVPSRYTLILRDKKTTYWEVEPPLFLLFNPWCKDDDVYLADEAMRTEYVMKQNGFIYTGAASKPRPRNWYFGQFEEVSLDAAFILLEDAVPTNKDSVAQLVRRICALIDNHDIGDNNGVIASNWSGNYEGGRPPSYWCSTPAILEMFLTTGQSVKWGQCWVYSAVVTTVLRTLGIPCRCVTNFYSAANKDGACTFDIYLDQNGERISTLTNDNVWNFHCWNDVWMVRKDLPCGYNGWQAIDATPQERQRGVVQMGPASLRAVKEGDIGLPYDTDYILAQVNADKLYKQQNEHGQWQVTGFDQKSVGTRISTKGVGKCTRHDITSDYKYEDNAVLEREDVREKMVEAQHHEFRDCDEDIKVELHPEECEVEVGDDVSLFVRVINSSPYPRTVQLLLHGSIVRYNGAPKAYLQKYAESLVAAPRDSSETTFTVHASQYLTYLEDETMIKFCATASVDESGQVVCAEELININKPPLKITGLPEQLLAGVTQEFVISLTNPLESALTDCEIYIDGSIIPTRIYVKGIRDVPAGGKLVEAVRLTPHIPLPLHNKAVRSTKKSMTVSFTCRELGGLNHTLKVFVINIK